MHLFTASDGARIAWDEAGSGRPLVMLHGLMAHRGFFRAQDPLIAGHRLIGVDLRAHGGSDKDGALTLDRLAADVAELVAHLDLRDAIGIGWSLGAALLWRLLAGPEAARFAGAVIVDMTPKVLNEGDWSLGLTPDHCEARATAFAGDFPAFATLAGPAIFADGAVHGAWAAGEFAHNDGPAMGAIWRSLVAADLRPLLPRIVQPSLIIHGLRSPLYEPATAEYLAEALPNGRAIPFSRSGHAPHLEEPERFNALVADFAASLPHIHQKQPSN